MIISSIIGASSSNIPSRFDQVFDRTVGRAEMLNGGTLVKLNLDRGSPVGSGIHSKSKVLHCRLDMQIKIAPGNTAGVFTSFYLASRDPADEEINFNFIQNPRGRSYILETNIATNDNAHRIQRVRLWFDPTKDFNTYSIFWTRKNIVFYVNDIAIRNFNNMESSGVGFPKQPARIYANIMDMSLLGSPLKPNYSAAPFTVQLRSYKFRNVCAWFGQKSSCDYPGSGDTKWLDTRLDTPGMKQFIKQIRSKIMTYNYCTDRKKYNRGFPAECKAV